MMIPRSIPFELRSRLIFGGAVAQIGWGLLAMGMLFVPSFVANSDVTSIFRFAGEIAQVQGQVTGSHATGFSENSGRHSGTSARRKGRPIYLISYRFTVDGSSYEGISYAKSTSLKPGATVTIEFPKGNPAISRIKGMRRAPLAAWGALAGIFPLVGGAMALSALAKGIRRMRLLRHGLPALGRLKSRQRTDRSVNNRRVYKLTFAFTASDGRSYNAIVQTHLPRALQDEAEEPLLYYPTKPTRAVLLDDLPGYPRIDESGEIHVQKRQSPALVLVLPIVGVLISAATVWWMAG